MKYMKFDNKKTLRILMLSLDYSIASLSWYFFVFVASYYDDLEIN